MENNPKKKILVLGANGMLGHTVSLYFLERGYDVTTFSISPFPYGKNIVGDILNKATFDSLFSTTAFSYLINCMGILNDACDAHPDVASAINGKIPHQLANVCHSSGCKLITISTDYVFPKERGIYTEDSKPNPFNFYGETKMEGEVSDDCALTLRTSIIGPDMNVMGKGLVNYLLTHSSLKINGFTNSLWCGVTTLEFARFCEYSFTHELSGVVNLVNNCAISKYWLLRLIGKRFSIDLDIQPDCSIKSERVLMTNNPFIAAAIPTYEQMIDEMANWVMTHKSLYSHYFKAGCQ